MSIANTNLNVHKMRVIRYDENHIRPQVNIHTDDTNHLRPRPATNPALVINKTGKSPYINNTTNTWWTYDDEQKLYIDTHVFAYPEINIDSDQNWSLQAVNSVGIKDTYELESLSIEEIDAICQ